MGWVGYCEVCHHLHALPNYFDLHEYFLGHSEHSHKGNADERFHIFYVTEEEYREFMKNRNNPSFWKAWRSAKQVVNVPIFSGLVAGRIAFLKFACL